jgi:DNA-binding NarL/FixJ family response regulator
MLTGTEVKITLTPRQRQILDIIVTRGVSNKNIARMLHISESTVKLHMSSILKKFGLRNRTQLALFAKSYTLV